MPTVLSVDKCLDLLEAIACEPNGVGTRELSRKLGINVTTVHNLATTLLHRGYVQQDQESRKFSVGLRLMLLGRHSGLTHSLSEIAAPAVKKVVEELYETALLAVFHEGKIIPLIHIISPQALCVRDTGDMGEHAYCTAVGKLMLATLPEEALLNYLRETPLKKHTANTLASKDALLAELAKIKKQGYAIAADELCAGVSAMAVAVNDPWGHTIAGLGASMPTQRFGREQKDTALKILRVQSETITAALGKSATPANKPTA